MWDTDKAIRRKEPTQEGEESKIWQAGENIKESHEKYNKRKIKNKYWILKLRFAKQTYKSDQDPNTVTNPTSKIIDPLTNASVHEPQEVE